MFASLKILAALFLGVILVGAGLYLQSRSGSVQNPPIVVDDGDDETETPPPPVPTPTPVPTPVPPPDTGNIPYSIDGIQLVRSGQFGIGGRNYSWQFYRNRSYQCGVQGHYVFLLVEPAGSAQQSAPLWVLMPGGGAGYYDSNHNYHGTESMNQEPAYSALVAELQKHMYQRSQVVDTIVHRRMQEGWRVLMPVACDHDLYSGTGGTYPNNPHGANTVDGLPATMAAVYYGAHVRPTRQVFVHGTSAGSAGAWSLVQGFARNGVALNGALLDAYTHSTTLDAMQSDPGQCSELHREDPTFSLPQLRNKIGAFMADKGRYLESNLGGNLDAPLFTIIGEYDPYCCGDVTATALARDAGYSNNCRYAYSAVEKAIARQNSPLYQYAYVEDRGHVLSFRPEAIQTQLENWFKAVMATAPAQPWQGL